MLLLKRASLFLCAAIAVACLCGCSTAGRVQASTPASAPKDSATEASGGAFNQAGEPEEKGGEESREPASFAEAIQSEAAGLKIARETDQIVIVRANLDTTCTVSLHEKVDGVWQQTVSDDGVVGMGGVGQASEATMVTPAGAYGLGFAFGSAPNPGTQMEYRTTSGVTCWVDDPSSAYYNQLVYASQVDRDWSSAEWLADSPSSYKYAVFIQYNVDPVIPGAGSAFFLHCYSQSGSWGCVQTSESTMVQILQHLREGAKIVIDMGDEVLNY